MAPLTVNSILDAGTKPVTSVPTASDTAPIGSGFNTFAVYRNTSATPSTVTITVPGNTSYGQANPQPAIPVPITTGEVWIPLRKAYDPGTGLATLVTSAQPAGLTVTIVQTNWS